MALPLAPMGERGARTVVFRTPLPREALGDVLAIPGVGWGPGVITAAWDVAWRVGEILKYNVPPAPVGVGFEAPGMAAYDRCGFRERLRGYQKEACLFFLRRSWGIVSLPMRTGKSPVALAADQAIGAKHTLIVSPGPAKWVWVDEIAKWTGEAAVILEGRGGREVRRFCLVCRGTGVINDDWCAACRQLNGQSYGYEIFEVRTVSRPVHPPIEVPEYRAARAVVRRHINLLREPPMGPRYPRRAEIQALRASLEAARPQLYQCSVHREVTSLDPTALCARCRERMLGVLQSARYVIGNYEILIAQEHLSEEGGDLGMRVDLPGWAPTLAFQGFDVAILDEARLLRGRPTKERKGKSRRDRIIDALKRVQRVWCLDGTPVGGFTRDLWGPLDVCSDGLFGRPYKTFDERYCCGFYDAFGKWVADGRSVLAESELVRRLAFCLYKKERSEILPDLPPKTYQVERIEPVVPLGRASVHGRGTIELVGKAIGTTLEHKLQRVVDNVIAEISEGSCPFVLCFHPDSAATVAQAIEAELRKPQVAAALRHADPKVWLATGGNPRTRNEMAKAFVKHAENRLGGAFVSTHGVMQGGTSLRGASSVHVVELHHSPDAILQSTDRPNEVGITMGLAVVVYIVKGSIDEHVLAILGPKFETQVLLTKDEGARDAQRALIGERESSQAMWDRLTAHLDAVMDTS